MLPLGAGRVGGGGPAGGGEGQTEVPGQDTVHGKAGNRRLAKKEVTGMSKDTLAESQGEKGVWTTWKTERKGKEQTEQGKGPARRRGSERWRKVRNRQGGDQKKRQGKATGAEESGGWKAGQDRWGKKAKERREEVG